MSIGTIFFFFGGMGDLNSALHLLENALSLEPHL
jgi:hypothetical protein